VPNGVSEAWQLVGTDLKAANTWENPNAITAQKLANVALRDGKIALQLPPMSFTAVSVNG
jgi:alpha-L-arabinofuranosidase